MTDPRNNDRVSLWERMGKQGAYLGGEVQIDNVEYWINIFPNQDRQSGKQPAWSGNVRRKDAVQRPAGAPQQFIPNEFAQPERGSQAQHYDQHGRLLNEPFVNPAATGAMRQRACPTCNGTGYDATGVCSTCHQKGVIWEREEPGAG